MIEALCEKMERLRKEIEEFCCRMEEELMKISGKELEERSGG